MALVEDELILEVLAAAEDATLDGGKLEELVLAVVLAAADEATLGELTFAMLLDPPEATFGIGLPLELTLAVLLDTNEAMLELEGFTLEELALAMLDAAKESTLEEVALSELDTGEETILEKLALPVLDAAEETALEEVALPVLDAAEEIALEEVALPVLDAAEETTLEEVALARLDAVDEATLEELAFDGLDTELEGARLEALDRLETAGEPLLVPEVATPEDEPALVEPETAEEATIELEAGLTTEDLLDCATNLSLTTALAAADEDVLLWDALAVEDLTMEAEDDGLTEADD